ncbi:hypothetical protein LIER_20184 [Lithospermum erythrorhizon]|uniref:Uncharacterized protein n=1 Tax=Lithospermum erythrorhizon TaxID=34254 RepID=A0AAV3QLH8_LITER
MTRGEVKSLEDATSQHPKELWAVVERFNQSSEFEGAHSVAVDRFKKSPEFLDALGANAAYGFAELSLDALSEDEEDEEEAPPASDVAPRD